MVFSRKFLRACAPTGLPCRGIGQLDLHKPARTANVTEHLESPNQPGLIAKFPKDPTYLRDHIVGSYTNQKDKFVYSVVIIGAYHSLRCSIPHIKNNEGLGNVEYRLIPLHGPMTRAYNWQVFWQSKATYRLEVTRSNCLVESSS